MGWWRSPWDALGAPGACPWLSTFHSAGWRHEPLDSGDATGLQRPGEDAGALLRVLSHGLVVQRRKGGRLQVSCQTASLAPTTHSASPLPAPSAPPAPHLPPSPAYPAPSLLPPFSSGSHPHSTSALPTSLPPICSSCAPLSEGLWGI